MAKERTTWYRFIRWIARHLLIRFFTGGMRVVGAEKVPKIGPVILAPNHVSFFDPPVVSCASPRVVVFMAKEELFKPPVFGPLIRSLNAYPVKRGKGDTSAVRLALSELNDGSTLILFPEGTRGDGKTLLPMQAGVALLAQKTGASVVPVGICGTHKILPKGAKLPRFSRLKIVFGKPFKFEEVGGRTAFSERLEREIVEACHKAGLDVKTASQHESRTEPGSDGIGTETTPPGPA